TFSLSILYIFLFAFILLFLCSPPFPYTTLFRSGVLAAGEQQHGPLELGGDLADDMDGLGFQDIEGRQSGAGPLVDVGVVDKDSRSEEHTSELQSRFELVCRLLLEKTNTPYSYFD